MDCPCLVLVKVLLSHMRVLTIVTERGVTVSFPEQEVEHLVRCYLRVGGIVSSFILSFLHKVKNLKRSNC